LLKRLLEGAEEVQLHDDVLAAIEHAVLNEDADLPGEWLDHITKWEETRPGDDCPYVPQHNCASCTDRSIAITHYPTTVVSLDDMRKILDDEEKQRYDTDDVGIRRITTMAGFILTVFSAEQKR
jgi:hypothetical protein